MRLTDHQRRALRVLHSHPGTGHDARALHAAGCGANVSAVARTANSLVAKGLAVRVPAPGTAKGAPDVYLITDDGQALAWT